MEVLATPIVLLLVLLSATFGTALFFCCLHCLEGQATAAKDGCRLPLQAIPVVLYIDNGIDSLQECAVCLAELEEGEKVKVIPVCGHTFHSLCIDRWFVSSCSCPLCRRSTKIPALFIA